jgi:hypothetical protein
MDITMDDILKVQPKEPQQTDLNVEAILKRLPEYLGMATDLLKQINIMKGVTPAAGGVMQSRPEEMRTAPTSSPAGLSFEGIKAMLGTIIDSQGDIPISKLLNLLEENKEMIQSQLGGIND